MKKILYQKKKLLSVNFKICPNNELNFIEFEDFFYFESLFGKRRQKPSSFN